MFFLQVLILMIYRKKMNKKTWITRETNLLGSLEARVQLSATFIAAVLHTVPAVLNADQQILDQGDVLLLAEVLQLGAGAV